MKTITLIIGLLVVGCETPTPEKKQKSLRGVEGDQSKLRLPFGIPLVELPSPGAKFTLVPTHHAVTSTKSFDEVYAAVEQTCKELNFEIYKNEKKASTGRITANSNFGKVTFVVARTATKLTSLSVRVGTFGNKAIQDLIYAKLKPKL